MKIHNCAQGEIEWVRLRLGRPTASEFDNIMDRSFNPRTGDTPKTYMHKKLAEAWRNAPLPSAFTRDMEQGELLEMEAIRWFDMNHDYQIKRVGFCEHDNGRCGASPDALLGDVSGLELKCPAAHTHVKYLLDGKLPADYMGQVHGSLYVTGRPYWMFLSYHRGFPKLVVKVERDEKIIAKIDAALNGFYEAFDAAMAKLRGRQ